MQVERQDQVKNNLYTRIVLFQKHTKQRTQFAFLLLQAISASFSLLLSHFIGDFVWQNSDFEQATFHSFIPICIYVECIKIVRSCQHCHNLSTHNFVVMFLFMFWIIIEYVLKCDIICSNLVIYVLIFYKTNLLSYVPKNYIIF